MVFKWVIIGDTNEEAVHVHYMYLLDTELWVLLGNSIEMAFHQWHWGRCCILTVQVSWETELLKSVEFYSDRWAWNGHLSVAVGKKVCMFIIQVSWETELFQLIVLVRRWSSDGHLLMTLGNTQTVHCSGLWETELVESLQFFLKDSLEMIVHWWHGGRDCTVIIQVSKENELC